MRPIISVESLGKEYVIGAAAAKHGTLREAVMRVVRSPARMFTHAEDTTVWALRDVSFTAVRAMSSASSAKTARGSRRC